MSKSLGDVLKETRERAGLSQNALSKRIGMTQAQLSRLEAGKRIDPGFVTMAKIARATGVSLDQLAIDAGLLPAENQRRPLNSELRGMSRRATRARELLKKLDQELHHLSSRLDPEKKGQ